MLITYFISTQVVNLVGKLLYVISDVRCLHMESLKSVTISTGVLGANTVFRFFLETFQTGDPDNKRD